MAPRSACALALFSVVFLLTGCAAVRPSGPGPELFNAAQYGNAAKVRELLAQKVDPNATGVVCPPPQFGTAIMAAAANGQTEIVRLLAAAGADVNRQVAKTMQWPCNYYTPLIFAAKAGATEAAKALLGAGADPSIRGGRFSGRSPAEWARKEGHAETAELLAKAESMSREARMKEWGGGATPAIAAGASDASTASSPAAPYGGAASDAGSAAPAAEPAPKYEKPKPRELSKDELKFLESQL